MQARRSTSRPQWSTPTTWRARHKSSPGLSVDEFKRAYEDGELDESDPAVSELVALLRIGAAETGRHHSR